MSSVVESVIKDIDAVDRAPMEDALPAADVPITVIAPPTGWQLINVRELWRFRELLYFLTWRDVKIRYKQTMLGAAWAVLQPALMMVVFTIFFGSMAGVSSGDLPYPLFAYAGLLPWTFFATAIANAGNSVVGSERLITKIYFPRLAIPFAAAGAALVDFFVALGLLVVLMLFYGIVPSISVVMVVPVLATLLLTALGFGTLLAALNVAYRDFRYVIPFLMQFWMFATPAVYMATPESAPGYAQALLTLNPANGLIATFRASMLGGPIPWLDLGAACAVAVVAFVLGCLYFRKVEDTFADII